MGFDTDNANSPPYVAPEFTIPAIQFTGGSASSYDLRQHYASAIGAETVTNIQLRAGASPLPAWLSINVGNESLDFDGSQAGPVTHRGFGIIVTTV